MYIGQVHSPIQATDNRVDETTPLVPSFSSGDFSYRDKFKGKRQLNMYRFYPQIMKPLSYTDIPLHEHQNNIM